MLGLDDRGSFFFQSFLAWIGSDFRTRASVLAANLDLKDCVCSDRLLRRRRSRARRSFQVRVRHENPDTGSWPMRIATWPISVIGTTSDSIFISLEFRKCLDGPSDPAPKLHQLPAQDGWWNDLHRRRGRDRRDLFRGRLQKNPQSRVVRAGQAAWGMNRQPRVLPCITAGRLCLTNVMPMRSTTASRHPNRRRAMRSNFLVSIQKHVIRGSNTAPRRNGAKADLNIVIRNMCGGYERTAFASSVEVRQKDMKIPLGWVRDATVKQKSIRSDRFAPVEDISVRGT